MNRPGRLSGDGSLATFISSGVDLIPIDDNFAQDVFARDLKTLGSSTELISRRDPALPGERSLTGNYASGDRLDGSISSDGRYVAFVSNATNMTGLADPPSYPPVYDTQAYVRDRVSGTTRLVSLPIGSFMDFPTEPHLQLGRVADQNPILSADGKYVAFIQHVGSNGGSDNVFVRDLSTGSVRDATIGPDGAPFHSVLRVFSISADDQEMLIYAIGFQLDPNEGPPTTIADFSGSRSI